MGSVIGPRDLTPSPDLAHDAPLGGPVRRRLPLYVDLLPPCNAACPAGENIQAWLAHARAGRDEEAWAALTADNPFPAIEGRVCYRRCETACNRAELDSAVSIHAVERFLGDRARSVAGGSRARWCGPGSGCSSSAAGPAACRPPTTSRAGPRRRLRDAGSELGGMMRYGIPAYRLPRDVLDAELARHGGLGVQSCRGTASTDLAEERRAGGSTPSSSPSAPSSPSGSTSPPPTPAASSTRSSSCTTSPAGSARSRSPGRRLRRREHRDGRRPHRRAAGRRGHRRDLPPHPRRMPADEEEATGAEREGVRMRWLSTVTEMTAGTWSSRRWSSTRRGAPAHRTDHDAGRRHPDPRTGPAGRHRLPAAGRRRRVRRRRVVIVDDAMMTGAPGVFAGGDMVPTERTVTIGVGHGRRAARHIDAWLSRQPVPDGRPKHPWPLRPAAPWYAAPPSAAARARLGPPLPVRGVFAASTPTPASLRGPPLPLLRQLLRVTRCINACPDHAILKLGPGQPLPVRLRPVHGLCRLRRPVPGARDRDGCRRPDS